jgi:NAD(P)-dependent dehydrogenase (short-subunit alcohol dehydrogenase family)
MPETQDLHGRIALVTGAGRGLGRAIARAIARQGADLLLVGRTADTIEEARAEIARDTGVRVEHLVGDVRLPETAQAALARAHDLLGPVKILVNNAQEIVVGPLLTLNRQDFTATWESGPMAALEFMKAAHQDLCGDGVVINLLSGSGIRWDMDTLGAYGAAKQALGAITRTAACEWGPLGIRVLGVMPNAVTDTWRSFETDYPDSAQDMVNHIPLRHMGSADDVARMIALLCTPAASYMTGSVVKIDGGLAP